MVRGPGKTAARAGKVAARAKKSGAGTRTSEVRSGRWTLVRRAGAADLHYEPSKSTERLTLALTPLQLVELRTIARRGEPAALRDYLLTPEIRAEALQGQAVSAIIAANTWRWALPLFGGPRPSEPAKRTKQP